MQLVDRPTETKPFGAALQTTLSHPHVFDGIGLHSGKPAQMRICPAPQDHGIWFYRTDMLIGDNAIPARWDRVEGSALCTKLTNEAGMSVSTVEHVLAALSGCGVHNARIEIDGPEVPILDGSAIPYVLSILEQGLEYFDAPLMALRVLQEVRFGTDQGWAKLIPSNVPMMSFHINFDAAAIGIQDKTLNMSNGSFVRELCNSRTFCNNSDVDAMRANGLALGGSLENAVVVDGSEVLTPGGLRHADEAVRHKMLDALGDLTLAGAPILGHYIGHRAGHAITNGLLRKLFTTPDAVELVVCDTDLAEILPGVGATLEECVHVA